MRQKGREPHDGVVSPKRSAIPGPPGGAHRIGAHAVAHPELEDAREGGDRGRADDEALENADTRIGLADSHHPQDRRAVHQTVGVERDHEIIGRAETLAKITDVSGLVAVIARPASVMQLGRVVALRISPGLEGRLLLRRDRGVARVAEHEPIERTAFAGRLDALLHGPQTPHRARRVFVANGHQHGCAGR